MRLKLIDSPNFTKKNRSKKNIKFLIIHYTGMQSESESIKRLTDIKSKVSSHYLINRKGNIIQMVSEKYVAWHAGKSQWKNYINLNNSSIGIELVNRGHEFGYQSFSFKQIKSLKLLLVKLVKKYKIKKNCILGHSDIAPLRKIDPGEKFPWSKVINFNFDKLNFKSSKLIAKNFSKKQITKLFIKNLYKIGYRYFNKNSYYINPLIIKAFQRRFRQSKVNGLIDKESFLLSNYIANKLKI